MIYYNNPETCSLVIKNNSMIGRSGSLNCNTVVYECPCNIGRCQSCHINYIGHKTCTLSHRLSLHLQEGGIKQHYELKHGRKLTRGIIVNNTKNHYL